MEAVAELIAQNKLTVRADRTFPLADAAAAHELIQSGRAGGKVVLIVDE